MVPEARPEAGAERAPEPAETPGKRAGAWRGRDDRILAELAEADREEAGTDAELEGLAEAEETEEAGDRGDGEAEGPRGSPVPFDRLGPRAPDGYPTALPTIRVLGFGVSRKKLEQSIRELQLPVVVVQDAEEAEVVITLRNYYRQKPPALREAEERALPIYVLKSNTIIQMEACLTSLYAIEVDPREAALRETEEAIGLVLNESRPVELSPQNAYIRRLQHQMAERANVVSQSRGREPYRRVRLYPDKARAWR